MAIKVVVRDFFAHIVSGKIAYHGNRCLRTLLCSIVVINSAKPLLMENSLRPAPFSQSENLETFLHGTT